MNENAAKIQAVINTMEGLEIKANRETMLKLLSMMQVLEEVRDAINKPAEEGAQDGGDDHAV